MFLGHKIKINCIQKLQLGPENQINENTNCKNKDIYTYKIIFGKYNYKIELMVGDMLRTQNRVRENSLSQSSMNKPHRMYSIQK